MSQDIICVVVFLLSTLSVRGLFRRVVSVACLLAVAIGVTMPTPANATATFTLVSPVDGATVGGPGGPAAVWQLTSVPAETTLVKVYLDQTMAGQQNYPPFTKGVIPDANGTHTFHLEVYAGTTLLGTTVPITLHIDSEWPVCLPVVSLTSPAPNSSLAGIITLSANATDTGSDVKSVTFYADGGVVLGKATTVPYTVNFDTTLLPDGRYHVMAQVLDNVGWANYSDTVIVTLANGLTTKTEWSKVIGSLDWWVKGESIGDVAVNLQDGSLLVTGAANYPPMNLGGQTITGNASYIYLAKYDEGGIYQWAKQFGYGQTMHGKAVALDASGNILLTANGGFSQYTLPQLDFGCGAVSEPVASTFEVVIAKLSPTGACLWSRASGISILGANADNYFAGWRIAADPGGNVIVGGQYAGSNSPPDFGGGPLPMSLVENPQGFLVKYSPSGAHLWSKGLGVFNTTTETGGVWILDVAVDVLGNVYATGKLAGGSADFGGTTLTAVPEPQIGDGDSFLAKYSPTGTLIWVKQFIGGAGPDSGTGVAADASGNAYVTGIFSGSVNVSGQSLTSLGSQDIFAASFTPAGTLRWAHSFGGTGQEQSSHVAIGPDGKLLMSLGFENSLDTGGAGMVTSAGSWDVLVMKLDPMSGATLAARTYGGDYIDKAPRLASDRASRPVLGGSFMSSALSVAGENQNTHQGIPMTTTGANANPMDALLVNMAIEGFSGDTNPPRVSIFLSPITGTTVTGTISVSAGVLDNVGVSRVEFFKDSDTTPFGTSTLSDSHSFFNTASLPNGLHTFKATAYDAAGNKNTAAITVTVSNGTTTYTLTVTTSGTGSGSVTLSPNQASYTAGTLVTLTAAPSASSTFTTWSGATSGTANPITIVMDTNKSVMATFTLRTYTLTTATQGTGSGTLTPAGTTTQTAGAVVALSATPATSSLFSGWSGDADCTDGSVTMTANKSCTGTFTLKSFTLTASAGANGTLSPSGSVSVDYGTNRTFTITPNAGYQVASVLMDGTSVDAVASYTLTNV